MRPGAAEHVPLHRAAGVKSQVAGDRRQESGDRSQAAAVEDPSLPPACGLPPVSWPLLIALALSVVTEVPYVLGYAWAPPGRVFDGFVGLSDDQTTMVTLAALVTRNAMIGVEVVRKDR